MSNVVINDLHTVLIADKLPGMMPNGVAGKQLAKDYIAPVFLVTMRRNTLRMRWLDIINSRYTTMNWPGTLLSRDVKIITSIMQRCVDRNVIAEVFTAHERIRETNPPK